ncbi:serine hydrolase domain-containing protein [Pseudonocardia humida]|uniref:Beta-lactamase family protein n=1 Tax=Pseudonocardia humida TaxID=2800819 RepID=A0ABT0ZT54_9PSEU|nr:serine hydrolase domain-containing protein [Pseudonocardia humida]MCO1653899.1 beta-lactamase family protein [Pseudonocardia humida]
MAEFGSGSGGGRRAVQRLLDRAVVEAGLPGIVAAVRDGDGEWSGSAGVADTATGRARHPDDRFRIGSATKMVVAAVVLQLAGEGVLGLDDPVERWLPGVVRGHGHDGALVAVRQLLDHTSGVHSYTEDMDRLSRFPAYTPQLLVELAMDHPPDFPPGTGWRYSQTNYVLAGMIVERATGRALEGEIDRRIARPLGLEGTYLPVGGDPTIRGPHARHYTKMTDPAPDAAVHDATELDPSMFWAAGGMVSTTGDLLRFLAALLGGRLLGPAEQQRMVRTVPTVDWIADSAYGLGISALALPCGTTVWGMGGALFGSWTYAYGSPDGAHLVVLNTNGDWGGGGWADPIGVFTDVLRAEFCPGR